MTWLLSLFSAFASDPSSLPDNEKVEKVESMFRQYQSVGFAKVPDVLPEQMGSLEDPVIVDVRPAQERKVSWIPGSIDKETFEAHPEQYRDRPVVTYCTIGARSGVYAKKLQNDGWDVRNLHGSLLLWTHAGLPLENAEGPTKTVHTYGKQWALVAEGYTAVW